MARILQKSKPERSARNLLQLSVALNYFFWQESQKGSMEYRDFDPKRETPNLIRRVASDKQKSKKIARIAEHYPFEWAPSRRAAYILRAYSGLQVFPDANHRTGLAIMRFLLDEDGYRFNLVGAELERFIDAIRNPRSPYCARCNAGMLLHENASFSYIVAVVEAHVERLSRVSRLARWFGRHLSGRRRSPLILTTYGVEPEEAERARKESRAP